MTKIIQTGKDSLKGGIFFGSSLTPNGAFINQIPKNIDFNAIQDSISSEFELARFENGEIFTLAKFKEALENELDSDINIDTDTKIFKTFLSNSIQLLIDYKDVRNFIFYGSTYVEAAFYLTNIIKNFPYKGFIASDNLNGLTINNLAENKTEIIFNNIDNVLRGKEIYTFREFYNQDIKPQLNIVDKTGAKFPIIDIESPIFQNISNILYDNDFTEIEFNQNHNLQDADLIRIKDCNNTKLNNFFYVLTIDNQTIRLKKDINLLIDIVETPVTYNGEARLRKEFINFPVQTNVRIIVDGNISFQNQIEFEEFNVEYKGLFIEQNAQKKFEFFQTISEFEQSILDKKNPKTWPRDTFTDNILTNGDAFELWIRDPGLFQTDFNYEEDNGITSFDIDLKTELELQSAYFLDENWTNNLLRKALPKYVVDELRDTEGLFKRLILIAGWFFDQFNQYAEFIAFNKHLNYSNFNQLSVQFYNLYSKHFGLDLFENDNIELSKMLLRTEPGLIFRNNQPTFSDEFNRKKVLLLQKEQQKRLLINLMYLYKSKGTLSGLNKVIELLGTPEGLITTNEYFYDSENKEVLIDNEKIEIPNVSFNRLNDGSFERVIDNSNKVNLRKMDLETDPQNALIQDILKFGTQTKKRCVLKEGDWFSLQNKEEEYQLLPLSIPNKFWFIDTEFNLTKTREKNRSAVILALYQTDEISPNINQSNTLPIYQPNDLKSYFFERYGWLNISKIKFSGVQGDLLTIKIFNNTIVSYELTDELIKDLNRIVNIINTTNNNVTKLYAYHDNDFIYITGLDNNLSNNFLLIEGDVQIIENNPFTPTYPLGIYQYVICKIENERLVFRARLIKQDGTNEVFELVGKTNIYIPKYDGLDNKLRFQFRNSGIELFENLTFKEFIQWKDAKTGASVQNTQLFQSYFVKFEDIDDCDEIILPKDFHAIPNNKNFDNIQPFDVFIGDCHGIEMEIIRFAICEQNSINQDNNILLGIQPNNFNALGYIFNPNINKNVFDVVYSPKFPLINNEDISYIPEKDNNNVFTKISLNPQFGFINRFSNFIINKQPFYRNLRVGMSLNQLIRLKGYERDHTLYEDYNVLERMVENYYTFSKQIITFQNIYTIIRLIESKYKNFLDQFIPIVIENEGTKTVYRNLLPIKFKYNQINHICETRIIGSRAFILIKVNAGDYGSTFKIEIPELGIFEAIWSQSDFHTLKVLGQSIKDLNPSNISFKAGNNILIIEIDEDCFSNTYNENLIEQDILLSDIENWDVSCYENFQEGFDSQEGDCFELEYYVPVERINDKYYIYYKDENGHKNYIFYDSESTDDFYRFTNEN